MTDINLEIERDLTDIGVNPVFYFPESFNELPAVTFYNLTEKGHFSMDNTEAITYGAVQIDVWDRHGDTVGRLALRITEGLTEKGWAREFAGDMPPDESGAYHRTMRFSKIFND